MSGLSLAAGPEVVVGLETGDDAGVVRLRDDLAVITTADFITPPFDDPYVYGQIAAANALSDVYAMGGDVVTAIHLCAFPRALSGRQAREILSGSAERVRTAGASVVGGHTVAAPELFFGLAVTGAVHPARVWRNRGLRPGDTLVLTKPLGTGILVGAARAGAVAGPPLDAAIRSMVALNRDAAHVAALFSPSAVTDVTGFALAGHGLGMARPSGVSLHLSLSALPAFDQAVELSVAGFTCRGERANRAATEAELVVPASLERDPRIALVFDPQTSGGLLVGIDATTAPDLVDALREAGVEHATVVGRCEAAGPEGARLVLES